MLYINILLGPFKNIKIQFLISVVSRNEQISSQMLLILYKYINIIFSWYVISIFLETFSKKVDKKFLYIMLIACTTQKYHKNQKRYDLYCHWEQNCIFLRVASISGIIWQHFIWSFLFSSNWAALLQYFLTMQSAVKSAKKLQFWEVALCFAS